MLTHDRATALRAELRELHLKSGYTVDDIARIDEIGQTIAETITERSRRATIDHLGAPADLGTGGFQPPTATPG
jgi:hypothetical protein